MQNRRVCNRYRSLSSDRHLRTNPSSPPPKRTTNWRSTTALNDSTNNINNGWVKDVTEMG